MDKMYAIVEIAGIQYKVFQDQFIYVPHLGGAYQEGEEIIFNTILLLTGKIIIYGPSNNTEKVQVKGKIMAHIKDDKGTIFKKKRRKGYQLRRGHRQKISIVKILSIEA